MTPHFLPSYMDVDSPHPKHIMRTRYSDCFYTVSSSYSLLGIYFLHSSILAGSLRPSERVPQDLLEQDLINTLLDGVISPCLAWLFFFLTKPGILKRYNVSQIIPSSCQDLTCEEGR